MAREVVRVSDVPSQRVERYELLAELAAGGMATVFLARLRGAGGFQRLCAIKRLHPHLANEREFIEMFLDEARLAARIHHPNVVPILEVGTSDIGYYLVMEYIEGETLARLLGRTASKDNLFPIRVGAKIVLDTLAGLEAAHGLLDDFGELLHIVHRDVSPQNVMVGVDGTARITDFGVARAATRLTTTRAGQLKGKLGYMAPEQAQGEDIDLRADVFAMGVILWETLTGRRLFKGKSGAGDAQILNRLLYEPVPKLLDTNPNVPAVFEQICNRALERDPAKRFQSCGEFTDALEAAMLQIGGTASAREVASFVDSVAGPEIETQRDAVRNWVARSEIGQIGRSDQQAPTLPADASSHASPFGLGSSSKHPHAIEHPPPRSNRSRVGFVVGATIAITLAVGVGATSVLLLTSNATTASAPAPDTATRESTIVDAPEVTTPQTMVDPTTSASAASPAASSATSPATSPAASASAVEPMTDPTVENTSRVPISTDRRQGYPTRKNNGNRPAGSTTEKLPPDDPPSDDLNTNPYR